MKTEFTRRKEGLLSNYSHNAVMQLVAVLGMGFILLHAVNIIILVLSDEPKTVFHNIVLPQVALQSWDVFMHRPWILATYLLGHTSFWNLLSNMLWMYCFASVIQNLVGYKEIIPLYIISSLISGLAYIGVSAFWPATQGLMYLGALPGIMAFAIGAITLAPGFRFHLGENLAIPLWVLLVIFLLLNGLNFAPNSPGMLVLAGTGAITGFIYIRTLRAGNRPGLWLYNTGNTMQGWVTPKEFNPAHHQKRRNQALKQVKQEKEVSTADSVDMLLDKISQKGYDSLTAEEKELLMRASKEG
ncbi:rhomboid family intramembrane serine protease [Taibaiella chishuiensis]|uniref:Rhomboid family protein n=1 Tax=Taibaiella chishuiensis TaxID=1434707 RepID=A0A2P8DCJ7_9BACT|nr:rhomboid family intramembrane serine protease [Taibaiella chishuiensis]PSK94943.1 rhomboid family protein [Taibaiella chishuiensis]